MLQRTTLAVTAVWLSLSLAVATGASRADGVEDEPETEGAAEATPQPPPVSARPPARAERGVDGLRKVVAVARFENRASVEGQLALNDAMADQLTDALIRSGRFTVLERQTVGDVLEEQDFANSGRVMKRDSARTGRVVAAQILIKGTITEYEGTASSSLRGVDVGWLAVGKSASKAHVGLMIRLIDSTTGEVLDSQRVEGSSAGSGTGVRVGFWGQQSSQKAPMAQATQHAIDEAVEIISARLAEVPFEGRVIRNLGGRLVISAGNTVGAEVGDEFAVFALGEEFVDPYTGESLGRDEREAGVVRITEVKEKYSKAEPVGGLGAVKEGDIVRALGR